MRRTRHIVLPVRSWQYIGLLIVSLACLTLGLISRDREGRAGSLAGPELEHHAPHEVDACPNFTFFTKMPSYPITESEGTTKSVNDHEVVTIDYKLPSQKSVSPTTRRSVLSRSLDLGRSSKNDQQKTRERSFRNRDLRTVEKLSRSRNRVSNNESLRENRLRTIVQSRDVRNLADSIAWRSQSQNVPTRANDRRSIERISLSRRSADHVDYRFENHLSRSMEQRGINEIARRLNRVDRSVDRRNLLNLQRRANDDRDHSSLLAERRILSVDRRQTREVSTGQRAFRNLAYRTDRRSEMRERKSIRSVERFDSNVVERRAMEHWDAERRSYREDRRNLLDRSARVARQDIDRNNNRRNLKRSMEIRHDRIASQEPRSRFSMTAGESRENMNKFNDRRSLSRSRKHLDVNDLAGRQTKSVDSETEKSNDRRSLIRYAERREINYAERQRDNRIQKNRRSLDRVTSPENTRREKINRLQRSVSGRDSRANIIRANSKAILSRETRSPYDLEEENRERRERFARSLHSPDHNLMNRREFSRNRDSADYDRRLRDFLRRNHNLVDEEKRKRLHRSHEERRAVSQESRSSEKEFERRMPGKILEKRMSHERTQEKTPAQRAASVRRDSRRFSERKIDESSRERSIEADRRLKRSSELQLSRGRIMEKRSVSQRLSERRLDESSGSYERVKTAHLERSSVSRDFVSMERRVNSRASIFQNDVLRSSEAKSDARRNLQIQGLRERRMIRSVENRITKKDSVGQLRQGLPNLNMKDPLKHASRRRAIQTSQVSEQNHEQRRSTAERMLSWLADQDRLATKQERNLRDIRADRNFEIRTKIASNSMKNDEFSKYPVTYELIKQALVVALCTVYGLSIYNGKRSVIRNHVVQQVQRFITW